MLHREEVAADVGLIMRDVITAETRFTVNDPDGFHFQLTPPEAPPDGWRAERRSWDVLLSRIMQALHDRRPEYNGLSFSIKEDDATLTRPLSVMRTMLIDRTNVGVRHVDGENPDTFQDKDFWSVNFGVKS